MLEKPSIEYIFKMHCKRTPPNPCYYSYENYVLLAFLVWKVLAANNTPTVCVSYSVTVQFRRCVHLGISKG